MSRAEIILLTGIALWCLWSFAAPAGAQIDADIAARR